VSRAPRGPTDTFRAIARLACFRADGMDAIGDQTRDFLNSLAPLIGFALAGTLLGAASGDVVDALDDLLLTIVVLLTSPVVSHALARLWQREATWLRYATAVTWCLWPILAVFAAVLLLLASVLDGTAGAAQAALDGAKFAAGAYGLALNWFLARRGLAISRLRTAALIVCVNVATYAFALGPVLAAP
jgi:hypothetical protein